MSERLAEYLSPESIRQRSMHHIEMINRVDKLEAALQRAINLIRLQCPGDEAEALIEAIREELR
jgi:hypothetical protein